MEVITILAIIQTLVFMISAICCALIHNYIARKPPGWQSIPDLLILDGLKAFSILLSLILSMNLTGIFYGKLPLGRGKILTS